MKKQDKNQFNKEFNKLKWKYFWQYKVIEVSAILIFILASFTIGNIITNNYPDFIIRDQEGWFSSTSNLLVIFMTGSFWFATCVILLTGIFFVIKFWIVINFEKAVNKAYYEMDKNKRWRKLK